MNAKTKRTLLWFGRMAATIFLSYSIAVPLRTYLHRKETAQTQPTHEQSQPAEQPAEPAPATSAKVPDKPAPSRVNAPNSGESGPPLYSTGYARRGNRVVFQMSDGTVRTEEDNSPGHLDRITYHARNYFDYDGARYWFRPRMYGQGGALGTQPVSSPESNANHLQLQPAISHDLPRKDIAPQEVERPQPADEASGGQGSPVTREVGRPSNIGELTLLPTTRTIVLTRPPQRANRVDAQQPTRAGAQPKDGKTLRGTSNPAQPVKELPRSNQIKP